MLNTEFLITPFSERPHVALAVTELTVQAMKRAGVTLIEADTGAMAFIARRLGVLQEDEELPSQLLIARSGAQSKNQDIKLPRYKDDKSGIYFAPNDMRPTMRTFASRPRLVELAEEMNAQTFTSVTIEDWSEEGSRLHAAAYAGGLLLGQYPVYSQPKPNLLTRVEQVASGQILDYAKSRYLVERLKTYPDAMPAPFIITYGEAPLQPGSEQI